MSETSTIRADSYEQSAEDTSTELQMLLPSQCASAYAKFVRKHAQQDEWREGLGLNNSIEAHSSGIFTFYNHPLYLIPQVKILGLKLDQELVAWFSIMKLDSALSGLGGMYPVDMLLTLLTNFMRDKGSNAHRSQAADLLQAICIWMLEDFNRAERVDCRVYCRLSFALLYYTNRLVQLHDGAQQHIGRLSSWLFK
jgi:hypothetical protein